MSAQKKPLPLPLLFRDLANSNPVEIMRKQIAENTAKQEALDTAAAVESKKDEG